MLGTNVHHRMFRIPVDLAESIEFILQTSRYVELVLGVAWITIEDDLEGRLRRSLGINFAQSYAHNDAIRLIIIELIRVLHFMGLVLHKLDKFLHHKNLLLGTLNRTKETV